MSTSAVTFRSEFASKSVLHTGLFFLSDFHFNSIYGSAQRTALARRVRITEPLLTEEAYSATARSWLDVEFLFAGWGVVRFDANFLRRFPNLKAIFYGAGSVKGLVTEEFWESGIALTAASSANAIPVAEFTLSQILYALKQGWQQVFRLRQHRRYPEGPLYPSGAYGTTVALLSLGMTGRRVAELLRAFDVKVIAYDPFISDEAAMRLGVKKVSLEEAFAHADVVSCHTPWLKETERMIGREHFESMKASATFINTARGAVVHEEEMIEVLNRRPDLWAILDVTWPEPPAPDSPLYRLENVVLTPHIAGSCGLECNRLGQMMVEELERYQSGQPLRYAIDRAKVQIMA